MKYACTDPNCVISSDESQQNNKLEVCMDPICRILYIDLSSNQFWVLRDASLFENYFGGAGVAAKLLLQECPENTDPFSPENPIIFAIGPFVGIYPMASKTVAMFKSPHTGNLGESHAGGRSAMAIRMAGYGAIVIKGKSKKPIYLVIDDSKVSFRDASALWGNSSSYDSARIIRRNEKGSGYRSILRIGPAGENLISYASVITETYRHFGRLGLGAVFGSKNLKAVLISGKRSLSIPQMANYRKQYLEIYKEAINSDAMKKYHELGTPVNVLPLNKIKALPVNNLKKAYMDNPMPISGEEIAAKYLGRRIACSNCPIACIHIAALRTPHAKEPYFYKTTMVGYDYEPIYALGSMLGGIDTEEFLKLIEEVEKAGLDAMSTGVILAWATEAFEKGLINSMDTEGIVFSFGNYASYIKAIHKIIFPPNEFYKSLSKGVEFASTKYGGKEFALSFGGNEMPGYHTGAGTHLTFLTGARHSHLDSAGYSIDQKLLIKGESLSPKEMAMELFNEEAWRQVLASLSLCFFARNIYTPERVRELLKTLNLQFDEENLQKTGETILRLKNEFKKREGFDFNELRIPQRTLETPSSSGMINEDYIRAVVEEFRKLVFPLEEEISESIKH